MDHFVVTIIVYFSIGKLFYKIKDKNVVIRDTTICAMLMECIVCVCYCEMIRSCRGPSERFIQDRGFGERYTTQTLLTSLSNCSTSYHFGSSLSSVEMRLQRRWQKKTSKRSRRSDRLLPALTCVYV